MIQQQQQQQQTTCLPGERLGTADEFRAGPGTFQMDKFIISSLVGYKKITHNYNSNNSNSNDNNNNNNNNNEQHDTRPVIEVTHHKGRTVVPYVDAIVLVKITTVNPRMAKCTILCVNDITLQSDYSGLIRSRDVRATEKDKVEMYNCFRPGDVVKARVMSLGDSRSYYLTTASNELGVVFAKSDSGYSMVPLSWCQMQCVVTKVKENRKVAKPTPPPSKPSTTQ